MIVALLTALTAGQEPCAPPAPCPVLERAAAYNHAAMLAPGGYRATIETETSTLGRREGRIEGATLIEQTSSTVLWSNAGGFEQHVVGSRSFPNAIPLSRLAFLRIGWVIPTLTGERLQMIARNGPGETKFGETLRGPLAPEIIVHPLASDRDEYYRYTGGATVSRVIRGIARTVVAVEVMPRTGIPGEQTLFEGEMDLDQASGALVRLIGRVIVIGRPRRGGLFNFPSFEPTVTLVDLINQQSPGGGWLPETQRFEIQTASSLANGYGGARRVMSRFHDIEPLANPGSVVIGASTSGYELTSAPRDSLRAFRGWNLPAGSMTASVAEADFNRWRPDRLQPTGAPRLLIQGTNSGDFFRVNRIEGLYTGVSLTARLRDAAPGVSIRASGGYAWSEKAVRGFGGVRWDHTQWQVEGDAWRALDVTNKFRNQFDNPNLGGIAGRDPWDYVHRVGGGVAVTHSVGMATGSIVRFEAARVRDRAVTRNMDRSLFGGRLRDNRNITEGNYWRGRVLLDWNPAVSPLFAEDGIGVRGEIESAEGDLQYTRVEGRVVLRKSLSRVFVITRFHAGAVFAHNPPPQQLFELGGPAGLPGYDYKEFAGDRAVLLRTRVTYPFRFLDTPIRLGTGLTLPSLSPAISIGFQGGFTDAKTNGGLAAVRALGDKRDDKTGDLVLDGNGDPLPVSVATDKFRTSVDIRIGVFGDALAVGFARALEQGRKTKIIFAFGRQF